MREYVTFKCTVRHRKISEEMDKIIVIPRSPESPSKPMRVGRWIARRSMIAKNVRVRGKTE